MVDGPTLCQMGNEMERTEVLTVKVKAVEQGDTDFEAKRQKLLNQYPSGVPVHLILPQKYIDNPGLDVTNVPRECGLLTAQEVDITENYDGVSLAEAISSRRLTAVAVTTAFAKRAIIAHQMTNCLTEWFMDEAVQRARELDEYQQRNGRTIGPLHGVPISLKEMMQVKGHMRSFGLVATIEISDKDALLVKILRDLGAVFYVTTRQPQALMSTECASFFGRTLNPHNINLAPGGSSGGEGALLAMRGSVMGVGSDIGGSIRVPAVSCGIYGLKGTSGNLPFSLSGPFATGLNLNAVYGPMCHSLRDLDFFQRSVLSAKPHLRDPSLVPIPWTGLSTPMPARPLRIGIMFDDGIVKPHPPMTHAICWAQARLTAAGFDVTPFAIPKSNYALSLISQLFFPDGGVDIQRALAATGEPMMHLIKSALENVPNAGRDLSLGELATLRFQRDQYRLAFAASWTAQGDPDIVIAPCTIGAASQHDTAKYINYSAVWNLVDYPAVAFPTPVKVESKGERYSESANETLSDWDRYARELWGEGNGAQYRGAPIGLQAVARRNHDNQLFGALALLKDALQLS